MSTYCRMCEDYVEQVYLASSVGACHKCVTTIVRFERKKNFNAVMDLFFALREIKGTPTLRDLLRLARRIKLG
jgi:hypothetical protein